ncbi:MAG: hypothetical protein NUV78_02630 [Candidatus Zambryskibacteria bacterium]|nr:hypothetical protein [Candidatus Zambryskibacteria bacterium]
MVLIYLFILSGIVLMTMAVAKRLEEKRRTKVFLFKLISRGDSLAREFHHEAVNFYSASKEKTDFFIKKQLPMHSKSSLNKIISKVEEKMERHIDNLRDSRLLKKSDGISEFFKNISTVEKGVGELRGDIYNGESIETEAGPEAASEATPPEPIEIKFEIVEPKVQKTRKVPTKRKLKVTSDESGVSGLSN